MNANVKWVPDTNNEFVWQCCTSPPFIMIRDTDGHVYPACIEDLNRIAEDKTFERVKPSGWAATSHSSLEQRAASALNKIASEMVQIDSEVASTIAQNMSLLCADSASLPCEECGSPVSDHNNELHVLCSGCFNEGLL